MLGTAFSIGSNESPNHTLLCHRGNLVCNMWNEGIVGLTCFLQEL